jgi:hypothetical protein
MAQGKARLLAAKADMPPVLLADHGSPRWVVPVLGVLLFVIYLSNLRVLAAADSIPTRLLPFSILREGNLNLDEFSWLWADRLPYYVRFSDGHLYSGSTVALPLALVPLYALPTWYLVAADIGYDDVRARVLIVVMERCAALLTTAVLLYRVMPVVDWRWALADRDLCARQQHLGIASCAVATHLVDWCSSLAHIPRVGIASRTALLCAGLLTALMVGERPQTLGIALVTMAFVWRYHRRHLLMFAGLPAFAALLVAIYNLQTFRNLAGAYVHFDHFSTPLWTGVGGLLLSPNRGLLIYSPIMLFAFVGAVMVWRRPSPPWLRWLVVAFGWHLLIYGMFDEWWAGYTYGPRYLTEMLPVLTLWLTYGLVPYCRTPLLQTAVAWSRSTASRCRRSACTLTTTVGIASRWRCKRIRSGCGLARLAGGALARGHGAAAICAVARDRVLRPAAGARRRAHQERFANTVEVDAAPSRFEPGDGELRGTLCATTVPTPGPCSPATSACATPSFSSSAGTAMMRRYRASATSCACRATWSRAKPSTSMFHCRLPRRPEHIRWSCASRRRSTAPAGLATTTRSGSRRGSSDLQIEQAFEPAVSGTA